MEKVKKVGPYHLELKENGILFCRISSEEPERIELHKPLVEAIAELTNNKKVCLLAAHDDFALPSGEVRSNWAKKDTNPYSLAEAFITKTVALKLIANFYLLFEKPERPTRMFTNEEDAIQWLESFQN